MLCKTRPHTLHKNYWHPIKLLNSLFNWLKHKDNSWLMDFLIKDKMICCQRFYTTKFHRNCRKMDKTRVKNIWPWSKLHYFNKKYDFYIFAKFIFKYSSLSYFLPHSIAFEKLPLHLESIMSINPEIKVRLVVKLRVQY